MRSHFLGTLLLLATVIPPHGNSATTSTNTPAIAITREAAGVRIEFTGTLQAANSVTGTWADLTNAANPYVVELPAGQRFFRTREIASIFSSDEIVALNITGPLQEHFDLAYAGLPDGIFPPVREKPWFNGTIGVGQQVIPAELRVRGNSSLQECPFPKLKFKVSSTDRAGTPFFDAREVKIGTHCAEGGSGPIGRMRDERAAYREALVYELMHILEFVAPRVRRARIEYHDTSSTNRNTEVGWVVARNAMILDDAEVLAEGLGGRALDDSEVEGLTNANFGLQLVTDLHVFQVLIGNWDYSLSEDGTEAWNFDVVELPSLQLLPVAGDFDLSSFVTEEVQVDVPWDYHPDLPILERQARYDLEQIKGRVSEVNPEVFLNTRQRFEQKRAVIEAKIHSAILDGAGRTNAIAHVRAFFSAMASIESGGK